MDSPDPRSAMPTSGRTEYAVVTEHRLVRRPAGRLLWVCALVLSVALTAWVATAQAPSMESRLATDVHAALGARGFGAVRVVVHGRQVELRVPVGRDPVRVAAVAQAVPGVLTVSTTKVFASAGQARACRGLDRRMRRATGHQRILFAGTSTSLTAVGAQRLRAAARLLRGCRAAGAVVGGHTDSSVADPGELSLRRARVLVRALVRAGVAARRLEVRGYGDQFRLDGSTPAVRAANERGSIVVEGP